MKGQVVVLLLSVTAAFVSSADVPRPRGVGPEFAKFYKATDRFTCISNPSVHFPISQVNDDYCDCPDGSDEPGTSACSSLSPLSPQTPSTGAPQNLNRTLALPGFYCKNKGHNPTYIPFTYVNDGMCDYESCCDGSDEWASVGGIKCEDKCKSIGEEWKKHDEGRQKSQTNAAKRRKELVAAASKIRLEITDQIHNLAVKFEGSQMRVDALEKEKDDIERREKSKVVKATARGGKTSVLAGLAKTRIIEFKDALVGLRQQRNTYQEQLMELEKILSTFKEEYNPNFNDEGVKRAVRSWEEYAAKEKPQYGDAAYERDLEEMTKGDDSINWDEFEGAEEVTNAVEVSYLPVSVRSWLDRKLSDLRVLLINNGILASSSSSSSDTTENKVVRDARDRLSTAQNDHNENIRQKASHEEDLNRDYGRDDVFRSLKGTCLSLHAGEYEYELCWMDRVTQKSKKGGSQNGMGTFTRFDTLVVDEAVGPDGKGLGSGERVAMRYENGQHCWNGPSRMTTVVLGCAEKEEIWKVAEEEKCVYRMEVGTPAVCDGVAGVAGERDEL